MKPNEFDELLRQKFEQSDFEYNPRNWDRLEDQLDGRAKKRSLIMWWWVPMAGIAASVALAMAIPSALWQKPGEGKAGANSEMAQQHNAVHPQLMPAQELLQEPIAADNTVKKYTKATHKTSKHIPAKVENKTSDFVAIKFHDPAANTTTAPHKVVDLLSIREHCCK